jgi:hypothetical protein
VDGDYRNVLIATPTYAGKEYCFQRWIDCVHRLPAKPLVVDNSRRLEYFEKWRSRVNMVHIDLGDEPSHRRIALSMEYIRKYVLAHDYQWWFSLESDNLVPSYTLQFMLAQSDTEWITLPYPSRTTGQMLDRSFGCCLFSRSLLARVDFSEAPVDASTDGWFANAFQPKLKILHSAIVPEHIAERHT